MKSLKWHLPLLVLLMGAAPSDAQSQPSPEDFICDVGANKYQEDIIPASRPSISGRLQARATREDRYLPVAQATILNSDQTRMAGLRLMRVNRSKRLSVEAVSTIDPSKPLERHVLGTISPEGYLDFYITVTDQGRFIVRANKLHYEGKFPANETGDLRLACSSGRFDFTNLKMGELAVQPLD